MKNRKKNKEEYSFLIKCPEKDTSNYIIHISFDDSDTGEKGWGGLRVKDGKMVFEGTNVDQSAKVFFESVIKEIQMNPTFFEQFQKKEAI